MGSRTDSALTYLVRVGFNVDHTTGKGKNAKTDAHRHRFDAGTEVTSAVLEKVKADIGGLVEVWAIVDKATTVPDDDVDEDEEVLA